MKKSKGNPLIRANLKRHARTAWKDADRNWKAVLKNGSPAYSARKVREMGSVYGVGRIGRASWFAGYAAALDWFLNMMSKENRKWVKSRRRK